MRIDWLVPCRYAEADKDGTMTMVGAGIDTFWLEDSSLPADVGLFLAMRILGSRDEITSTHHLGVRLVRPESVEKEELASVQFQADPQHVPTDEVDPGFMIPLAVRLRVESFGQHRVAVVLDDEEQRDVLVFARPQDA